MSSQAAVNSRWKADGWICSVIWRLCLPTDSWNVPDDKRGASPSTATFRRRQSRLCLTGKGGGKKRPPPPLTFVTRTTKGVFSSSQSVLKQHNALYPNLPQITSNIIDLFCCCYQSDVELAVPPGGVRNCTSLKAARWFWCMFLFSADDLYKVKDE